MKRISFDRPTEHYDERLYPVDEQLCSLLKQRREASNNNPGFPPLEDIAKWAEKYQLYEDQLSTIFGVLRNEDEFRPQVEPINFEKYLPVHQSIEIDQRMYSVTFIRQYSNASVVNFNIDWEPDEEESFLHQRIWHLYLGEKYDCRQTGGGGTEGHISYHFIVSPRLPDDISGMDLRFKETHAPYEKDSTGLEIVFPIE